MAVVVVVVLGQESHQITLVVMLVRVAVVQVVQLFQQLLELLTQAVVQVEITALDAMVDLVLL
jgi:hypothetical protein